MKRISRRGFLRYCTSGSLAMAAVPFAPSAVVREPLPEASGQFGILVDTARCIGCRACQAACKKKNNLPEDAHHYPEYGKTFPGALSGTTFTVVEFYRVGGDDEHPVIGQAKKQCMHCVDPACASVCPVAAIWKTAQGPVVYDAERCIGCRYCLLACPFDVPRYEWESANPRVRKCDMCSDLVERGERPACVAACPVQALMFGSRDTLITEAQARLQARPETYIPYLYGLEEVGGTGVLYLARFPFARLGFNMTLPRTPLPERTWAVMEKVPAVAVGIGAVMSVTAWWTGRKDKKRDETPCDPV